MFEHDAERGCSQRCQELWASPHMARASKSLGLLGGEAAFFVFGQQFCVWSTVTEKHWERKREREMGGLQTNGHPSSDVLNVSFNKYLLSINYARNSSRTEGTSVSKTNRNPCLHAAYILMRVDPIINPAYRWTRSEWTVLIFQGRTANRWLLRRNYLISKSVPHQLYHDCSQKKCDCVRARPKSYGSVHFPLVITCFQKKSVGSPLLYRRQIQGCSAGLRAGPFPQPADLQCPYPRQGTPCFSPSLAPKSVQEHCRQLHRQGAITCWALGRIERPRRLP